jgi:hypothetical protein
MFGWFKKVIVEDSQLGPLRRRGSRWEGQIKLPNTASVELDIEGTRVAPHSEALNCAYELPTRLQSLVPYMSECLLEHLEPYRDSLLDPEEDFASHFDDPKIVEKVKAIQSPEQAWAASNIVGVEIGWDGANVILLIMIDAIWDEEHRLGVYFENWHGKGISGSV